MEEYIQEFDKLKTKVLKYVLYKKRTEKEIRQKFTEFSGDMLDDVIEHLKEIGYINDLDYINRAVIEFTKLKNMSIKEIEYKLLSKGINKNLIDDYIYKNKETLLDYELNSAKKIFIKKQNTLEQEEIKNYLRKKGYMRRNNKIIRGKIKMSNLLTLQTNKYAIKLDNFEGPLDLLCHLVDKNKMDINKVNITQITDQYIEYINTMKEMNLDITSEFVLMASTLLYIKSKSLLPKQVEDEGELTEEELISRIIEYKKYKEISKKLKEFYIQNSKKFFKLPDKIELPKRKIEKEYSRNLITENYIRLLENNKAKLNANAKNIERIAIIETVTVSSKVRDIFKELIKKPKFIFNKLCLTKKYTKLETVTAFTGLLELTKRNKVISEQEKIFGDITVKKARN